MSVAWVDSHCHLQEQYLPDEHGLAAAAALRRAADAAVVGVLCVGTDEKTSRQAIELVAAVEAGRLGAGLPVVRASIGLHPHEATQDLAWLGAILADERPGVVGVGECGLDYHYEHAPKEAQRRSFARQIALAHEHGLTLVIHARDAWDDLFDVLASEGVPPRTVLHCFTGGPAEAARCVTEGLWVSFSGIVTFKNAAPVRDAVREVPLERLLIETDSPWLAPVPHRGSTNEPALVGLVGEAVGAAGGWTAAQVATATGQAARSLFGFEVGA